MEEMEYLEKLKNALNQYANPEDASYMKKYLKDKFNFLGIKTPLRREITRPFLSKANLPDLDDAKRITRKLWKEPFREFQQVGIDLLVNFKKTAPIDMIDFYEWLIVNKSWWDTVDPIADYLAGAFFLQHPQLKHEYVDRWLRSENIWLQRTCIIFQLKYRQKTDLQTLEKAIHHCKDSNEFFLRKAIGWALRQYGKTDPAYVRDFVARTSLHPLSKREAIKNILIPE